MEMHLDTELALEFQQWMRGKVTEADYVFNELSAGDCMIYGTGSPQLLVLSLEVLVAMALNDRGLWETLCLVPPEVIKLMVERVRKGDHKSKTIFEGVSNYWLKSIASYSQKIDKIETGYYTGPKGDGVASQSQRSKTKKQVGGLFRGDEGGKFLERLHGSPFGIGDMFSEGKLKQARFDASADKTRNVTASSHKPLSRNDVIYDFAIRRACKFLLYDAIRQGKRVAYLLDCLDLNKVAYLVQGGSVPNEARIEEGDSEGKVPVCSTELREIFRNWDYFKKYLRFYMRFRECDPPWAEKYGKSAEWARYAAHRSKKILSGKNNASKFQIGEFEACIDKSTSRSSVAIKHFHAGAPSTFTNGSKLHVVTSELETL
jgi:hypothetical protein